MPAAICGRSGCGPAGRRSGLPHRPTAVGPGGGGTSPSLASSTHTTAAVAAAATETVAGPPPPAPFPPLPPSTGVRVAATAAGVATKLCLYPLDSLKVRVQTVRVARAAASSAGGAATAARAAGAAGVGGIALSASGGTAAAAGAAAGAASGAAVGSTAVGVPTGSALRVALRAVAQGGGGVVGVARRLYGGLPAAVVGVLPHAWVYMPVYVGVGEALKPHIPNRRARLTTAAATAGVAVSLVRVPLDACKKRVEAGAYPSLIAAARALLAAPPPVAAAAAHCRHHSRRCGPDPRGGGSSGGACTNGCPRGAPLPGMIRSGGLRCALCGGATDVP